MIELNLVGVRVELPSNQPIVLLREKEGERYLPIWIGAMEATAIAFALQGIITQRPMTHDLLKNVLEEIQVHVERIVITELRDGTFYATSNVCLYTPSSLSYASTAARCCAFKAPPWKIGATMSPAMLPRMLGAATGPPIACRTHDGEIVTLG